MTDSRFQEGRSQAIGSQSGKLLIPTLQAILDSSRDPTLTDNPDLDYTAAVEVCLLLKPVAGAGGTND